MATHTHHRAPLSTNTSCLLCYYNTKDNKFGYQIRFARDSPEGRDSRQRRQQANDQQCSSSKHKLLLSAVHLVDTNPVEEDSLLWAPNKKCQDRASKASAQGPKRKLQVRHVRDSDEARHIRQKRKEHRGQYGHERAAANGGWTVVEHKEGQNL